MKSNKPTIGLVGGIGSGKSLAAAELAKQGGRLIVADHLGHEALRQADVKDKVVARWGTDILDAAGEVDRRKLGRIVFADVQELRALEAMSFPYIGRRILEEVEAAGDDAEARFVVLDAAVMMEASWDRYCDKVIFVDAPRELRLQRLQDKRGWTAEEFTQREAMQFPLEKKKARASAVIANAAAPENLHDQVKRLVLEWRL